VRRVAFIQIDAGDIVTVFTRPAFQSLPLVEDAFAGSGLFFCAGLNPAVKCNFHAGATPPFEM